MRAADLRPHARLPERHFPLPDSGLCDKPQKVSRRTSVSRVRWKLEQSIVLLELLLQRDLASKYRKEAPGEGTCPQKIMLSAAK